MTRLAAFICGIAVTSLVFYIIDHIMSFLEYRKFRKWLVKMNVDIHEIDNKAFDKFYAMYEISKLPNVEIQEVTNKTEEAPK